MPRLLHVAFGHSAAGSLKLAVAAAGRRECVVAQLSNLSWGPINPPSGRHRRRVVEHVIGPQNAVEVGYHDAILWRAVSDPRVTPVVWFGRRSTRELCGLYELVRRRSTPPKIVDVADVRVVSNGRRLDITYPHFGYVGHGTIVDEDLFGRIRELTDADLGHARATWDRLRSEDAPCRVLSPQGLSSAPVDRFDPVVRSCVTNEWQSVSGVMTEVLQECGDGLTPHDQYVQVGFEFLWSRFVGLVEQGVLECTPDPPTLRDCRVRRRA